LRQIPPQAFYTKKIIKCPPDICRNFLVFAAAPAPEKSSGLDRKNTVIGKYREWQPHRTTCSLAQAWHTSRDSVARLEISYFRAENLVEAPPAPSCWDVSRHPDKLHRKNN